MKPNKKGLLGFKTSKYCDDLLVDGYVRLCSNKMRLRMVNDLYPIFYKFYHIEFKWNNNDKSKHLDIENNKYDQSTVINKRTGDRLWHTGFFDTRLLSNGTEQYEFELKLTGTKLRPSQCEIAFGIATDDYKTPYDARIGIGDCKYSTCYYMSGDRTNLWHGGRNVIDRVNSSPNIGDSWVCKIRNVENQKCKMDVFYKGYRNNVVSITVPIHGVKFGVSLFFKPPDRSNVFQLLNYNVINHV